MSRIRTGAPWEPGNDQLVKILGIGEFTFNLVAVFLRLLLDAAAGQLHVFPGQRGGNIAAAISRARFLAGSSQTRT